jgi:hypothetical protein
MEDAPAPESAPAKPKANILVDAISMPKDTSSPNPQMSTTTKVAFGLFGLLVVLATLSSSRSSSYTNENRTSVYTSESNGDIALPSCVPADRDTMRSPRTVCRAKSVKLTGELLVVLLSVEGFSPGRNFGGNGYVSCRGFNAEGQLVGSDRKEWNGVGSVNELARVSFFVVEKPATLSCEYRLFDNP